jgi:hypothetical protein
MPATSLTRPSIAIAALRLLRVLLEYASSPRLALARLDAPARRRSFLHDL